MEVLNIAFINAQALVIIMGLAPAGDDEEMKVLLFTLAEANQVSVIRVIRISEPEPVGQL